MAYRLDLENDLATATRLVARERLEKGVAVLSKERAEDPVAAVHEARKEIKKARSLLRLVRPALGKRTYRRENRALRDGARTVARVRDADVMVETVEALRERFAGRLPARTVTKVLNRVKEDAKRAREHTGDDLGADLVDALQGASMRIDEWPLDGVGWAAARKGITRAYARGREAFATADADPTPENLHESRKRVKDLWYHERRISVVARERAERTTFDFDVSVRAPAGDMARLDPRHAVAETKTAEGDGHWDRVLVEAGYEPISLSKYRIGIGILRAADDDRDYARAVKQHFEVHSTSQ